MGTVYRAVDERLQRPVALKLLRSTSRREGHLSEARTTAALTHPNVAAVYEAGEADGLSFIVLELVRGQTLRERLKVPLSAPAALQFLLQLASALEAVHGAGYVHGDVKPENAMVADDGGLKLLDFGLAISGADPAPVPRRGTHGYLAPEVEEGAQPSTRADVYAFGRVAEEVLAAVSPQSALSAVRTLARACVDPDPSRRPAEGAVLVSSLRSLSARTSRARLVTAAAVMGLVLAGGALLLSRRDRRPRLAPPPVAQRVFSMAQDVRSERAELSPDGQQLAISGDPGLVIHNLKEGTSRTVALPEDLGASDFAWLPDGKTWILSCPVEDGMGLVRYSEVDGRRELMAKGTFYILRLSPDARTLVALDPTPRIHLFDLVQGSHRTVDLPPEQLPFSFAFSPDSQDLAYVSLRGASTKEPLSLFLHHLADGRTQKVYQHPGAVDGNSYGAIAWLPDGRLAFTFTGHPQRTGTVGYLLERPSADSPAAAPIQLFAIPGVSIRSLTASITSNRLAYLTTSEQADVYWGDLSKPHEGELPLVNLTQNDADELAVGFVSPQTLLYRSDETGVSHAYLKTLEGADQREAVPGAEFLEPGPLSTSGRLLFWRPTKGDHAELVEISGSAPRTLTPVRGGFPASHPFKKSLMTSSCGRRLCVGGWERDGELEVVWFDWSEAKLVGSLRLREDPRRARGIALMEETQKAYLTLRIGPLYELDLTSGSARTVPLEAGCYANGLTVLPQQLLTFYVCMKGGEGLVEVDPVTAGVRWLAHRPGQKGTLLMTDGHSRVTMTLRNFVSKAWWLDVPAQ